MKSIIELIVEDHRKAQSLYDEYRQPQGLNNELRQKLAWAMIREISMHSSAEEEVMYPEVRKRLGDGAADHLLGEHTKLKVLLSDLNSMTREKDPAKFDAQVDEVYKELNHHIREEEDNFWPKFEKHTGVDSHVLSDLGSKFVSAKKHAVTRPHPWAPDKPPLNVMANMMTAPLDAAADQWRFGLNPPGQGPAI